MGRLIFPRKFAVMLHPEQLMSRRRVPYLPLLKERVAMKTERLRETFEKSLADGTTFQPDALLPPWKRRRENGVDRLNVSSRLLKVRGVRLRSLPLQPNPGFPTYPQ